jgi:hypothetical protein
MGVAGRNAEKHRMALDDHGATGLPVCGQPASTALAGSEHGWACRNEACPEFGQPIRDDEPPPSDAGEPSAP